VRSPIEESNIGTVSRPLGSSGDPPRWHLPSAFQSDPLTGADVNLSGSVELMRQSLAAGVQRFIFASSMAFMARFTLSDQ